MNVRIGAAALAFLAGAALPGLNAVISFQERGFVEPFDVPLAIVLVAAAVFTWRRSIAALLGGVAASIAALAIAAPSGAVPLLAFWIVVLLLALQAVPLMRSADAATA